MADVAIDTDPDSPLENGCAPAWSSATCPGGRHLADLRGRRRAVEVGRGRIGGEPTGSQRLDRLPSSGGSSVAAQPASWDATGVCTRGVASTRWR